VRLHQLKGIGPGWMISGLKAELSQLLRYRCSLSLCGAFAVHHLCEELSCKRLMVDQFCTGLAAARALVELPRLTISSIPFASRS
jgi:hypothetical protein